MRKNRLKAISLVFLLGLCTGLGTGEAGQVTIVAGGNGQGNGTNQLNTPFGIAVAGGRCTSWIGVMTGFKRYCRTGV